ncbi:uncharacterized protein LOC5577636 isoform X9 [Aedes aegypti]|uniref:Uncharacterized protein n=1 Tax=Aedes aegypti TaxID=7159 RepID=A0A6I8U8A9_AEDAE|nr:uncharacterized protein LOC5577636 isoform X9 [Aedes aegypti]
MFAERESHPVARAEKHHIFGRVSSATSRIDPPTFTTMESKKLQQLQQANSHLAPIPQTKPPTFQQQNNEYRPTRSPVFQNHPQYQSFASNFAQINYPHQIRPQQQHQQQQQQQQKQQLQQQQQQHLSAHSSPKSNSNSLYLSEYSSSSHAGQQQHHHTIGSHYHFDQIYQTSSPSSGSGERERLYQTAPRSTQHNHATNQQQPLTKLELQFQQLQREKIQAQIKTATEALAHQQQTFALRQQLNPPVPNYHLKQNLLQNLSQQHQQQIQQQQQHQQNRNAPPSSLNLTSHFQPAQGPMKLANPNIHDYGATAATNQHAMNEAFYQSSQQKHMHPKTPNNLQSPAPNQIIIQQNIPGQVVNQACQTQISGMKPQSQTQKSPNSDSLSSPSHDGLERRKSGPVHTLKSPVTKRPPNAPVSMSGWLFKQGSDGLKVWRRRWFVLAEYVLYYYKSQEEEKLLGTVLLPSYKISACFPEDKVYRKFAFKCEHTNMRTFVFAAETAESMTSWVRMLTLATMMLGSSESETSPPSNNARSGDNSDSGIQTYQSQICKTGIIQAPVTPVSDNGGGSQPLYANAPPKPRRATDGGYSSPSPEHLPDRYDHDPQQLRPNDPIYGVKTPDAMNNPNLVQSQSPLIKRGFNDQLAYDPNAYPSPSAQSSHNYNDALYGNAKRIERDLYIQKLIQQQQQQQQQLQQLQQQQQHKQQQLQALQQTPQQQQRAFTNPFMYPNATTDRRTPDTYGPPRAALEKHMSDYEDIYNLTMLSKSLPPNMGDEAAAAAVASGAYRRPMSPLRYEQQNSQNPAMPQRYTPNYLENSPAQQQHVQMRARPVQSTIPRPHSADFLDYEARNPIKAKQKDEPTRAPRPKSSLDINRTPDNYYYSEASYAEKMRMQSASYLQRANLGAMAGKMRGDEPQGVMNSSTVPRDGYYGSRMDYGDELQHGSASVPRTQRITMNNLKKYPSQQEQFLRSASARLPRKEEDPSARDGERKREESMKRLLEWKQRMLQSPLTRKISQQQQQQHQLALGSPGSTGEGNPFLAKSPGQIAMEAEMYLEQEKLLQQQHMQQQQQQQQLQQRRDSKTNLEYNSYSSDDEASISVRNVKNIPKVPLTVKPDPSDYRLNPQFQGFYEPPQTEYYYQEQDSYIRPDISFESTHDLYTQAQLQRAQEINLQQHYQLQDIDRSLAALSNQQSPEEKWPSTASKPMFASREQLTPSHDKSELRTLEMSAGDLLNRTHEELVLLLIQLRRQNSNTARSIEQCCTNIHDIQNSIRTSDGPTRAENLARLESLKKQLAELEKQYEKEKPLINLVDNMVKLGTLYRGAPGQKKTLGSESATLDRLEFNQRIQERRLLQEEQRQWDRLSPNHSELQSKVQQLYHIDQLLQEESGTLQSLQRDKEDLERALGGLKAKIMKADTPPMAIEAARQQQHTLERELSRVHLLLAENSKKLEKTVADNARLEQELLVLRQKLQASRDTQASMTPGQDGQYVGTASAVLESELRRVQLLVGDMQRQRQELSQAVRQLTDNSDTLYKQINKNGENRSHIKKRSHSTSWVETDLDSLTSKDQGRSESNSSLNLLDRSSSSMIGRIEHDRSEGFESCSIDSDDLLEDSSGNPFVYHDKQEIKTVRIVKRESERRNRDREKDRSNTSTHSLDQVLEEEAQIFEDYTNYHRSKSLPRGYETHEAFVQNQDIQTYANNLKDYYSMTANGNNSYPVSMIDRKADLYSGCDRQQAKSSASKQPNFSLVNPELPGLRTKTESIQSLTISEQSPVFQSEAAKQIIHEMVGNGPEQQGTANGSNGHSMSTAERQKQKAEHMAQQNKHRRSVPKEKRRHHTAPHHVTAKQLELLQSENDMNKNNINWRARDDVDLEVTIRPRSNAPDVVRSAIGPREKISEHTIDKLLAAPSKILIPERYVPEQAPELSPEEKRRRQEKVEAIKKMLSETPIAGNDTSPNQPANAEKRQREHLLQLNQILAQQVMQMSKIVAENSMAVLPSSICKLKKARGGGLLRTNSNGSGRKGGEDDEDEHYRSEMEDSDNTESPPEPLPLYQQRENYFT